MHYVEKRMNKISSIYTRLGKNLTDAYNINAVEDLIFWCRWLVLNALRAVAEERICDQFHVPCFVLAQ